MVDSGQYYGQPGYYPEWQAAGVARGNGQAPMLSRPEAIRLYEVNLAAYHEALRRRERHMWFFAATNFALAAGLVLAISLAATAAPAVVKASSFLALFVGLPICSAWRRALDQSRTERDLALGMVRKLEAEYGLRYSPLGDDAKPDPRAEQIAVARERFLPRVLFWLYLGVMVYVWQAEVLATGDWVLNTFAGFWDRIAGPRR